MNVFCARTYGCVKLIEGALSRPAHAPKHREWHVADEYALRGDVDGRWVAGELRVLHRRRSNREWLRHVSGPREQERQTTERIAA